MPSLNPSVRMYARALFRYSLLLSLMPLAGCGGSNPVVITGGLHYRITDVSDGRASDAVALNNKGDVAVTSDAYDIFNGFLTRSTSQHVPTSTTVPRRDLLPARPITLLYQAGKYTDLYPQIPRGLNDAGQIVGLGSVWQNGQVTRLPALDPRVSFSGVYAEGLNSAGQIVGAAVVVPQNLADPNSLGDVQHAFVYANGQMTDLGTLNEPPADSNLQPSSSIALAINDAGQIVGASDTGTNTAGGYTPTRHAFVWQNNKMTDLGTLGGFVSAATALNNHNQICGYAETASHEVRATLWQNGQAQDLQIAVQGSRAQGSRALGINDAGQIVGNMVVGVADEAPVTHAFVIINKQAHDLNKLAVNGGDWTLNSAVAINSRGQICGTGTYKGQTRAFLLTPQIAGG